MKQHTSMFLIISTLFCSTAIIAMDYRTSSHLSDDLSYEETTSEAQRPEQSCYLQCAKKCSIPLLVSCALGGSIVVGAWYLGSEIEHTTDRLLEPVYKIDADALNGALDVISRLNLTLTHDTMEIVRQLDPDAINEALRYVIKAATTVKKAEEFVKECPSAPRHIAHAITNIKKDCVISPYEKQSAEDVDHLPSATLNLEL